MEVGVIGFISNREGYHSGRKPMPMQCALDLVVHQSLLGIATVWVPKRNVL
jgi:hypothetical protein